MKVGQSGLNRTVVSVVIYVGNPIFPLFQTVTAFRTTEVDKVPSDLHVYCSSSGLGKLACPIKIPHYLANVLPHLKIIIYNVSFQIALQLISWYYFCCSWFRHEHIKCCTKRQIEIFLKETLCGFLHVQNLVWILVMWMFWCARISLVSKKSISVFIYQ